MALAQGSRSAEELTRAAARELADLVRRGAAASRRPRTSLARTSPGSRRSTAGSVAISREGLPLAVQLTAPPGREDLLLAIAGQLTERMPFPSWGER